MLLIEKMESALENIRESDFKSTLSEHSAVAAITETKEAFMGSFSGFKTKLVDAIPFASDEEFTKLDKKVAQLTRKMNQLKKQLKDLEN